MLDRGHDGHVLMKVITVKMTVYTYELTVV